VSDVIERLSQGLTPVKPPRPHAVTALLLMAAALSIVAFEVWMLGTRADVLLVATRLNAVVALAGAGLLAGFSLVALAALSEPGGRVATSATLGQALGSGLILASFALGGLPEGATAVDGLAIVGMKCTRAVATFALLPGLVSFALARRMAPPRPAAAARAAIVAAGAFGLAGVTFTCSADHLLHGLLYHAVPIALLAAVGGALLERVLRW